LQRQLRNFENHLVFKMGFRHQRTKERTRKELRKKRVGERFLEVLVIFLLLSSLEQRRCSTQKFTCFSVSTGVVTVSSHAL